MAEQFDVICTSYPDRDAWLKGRIGIGASEIGCVLGSGFKSAIDLWKEKTGKTKPKDLSDNERVQFGNAAEDPLRALFTVMHPEYELWFTPYTILRQRGEYDFLFDTPDGWLEEKATGRRGLYESKTSTCISKADWEKWENKVPDGYFSQVCQGMFCGGFDFAVIFALLKNADCDASIRAYTFERADCEWMIERIKEEGKAFWKNVQNKTVPATKLKL